MKKLLSAMCFILVLSVMLSPVCLAAGDNYDTLVNWNIKIAVPDDTTAVLKGNEYYIYAQHEGSIPYVMLRTYAYDDAEVFLSDFTDYMKQQYSDLRVTLDTTQKMIGNKRCYETDYTYKVSGYDVRDRRIAILFDGMTYMFTSKEVEANGMTIGTMLEDVIANCEFLSDETSETSNEAESATLSEAYLYCLENGMPKYWLDFTGVMSDNPVLHCYFRSSDPTFYESWFILDLSTAVQSGNEIRFYQVYDEYDFDHSNWFNNLAIRLYTDGIVMDVDRNERTLAGGAEDNILTGSYIMLPAGAGVGFEQVDQQMLLPYTYLKPEHDGPFTADELGEWLRAYYFFKSGFFPPQVDVEENGDGTFTIHLYEIVSLDGTTHTATSAWYTVDAYGNGQNDITEEAVNLLG